MDKILLTGAGGFLLSRVYNYYKDRYEILPLKSRDLDITDSEKVCQSFMDFKPDYVIHGAAISSTEVCRDNEKKAYKVNVEGTANVAMAARKVGAKLIYCSSEQIFNGNLESGPYNEEDIPCPNTVYGKTKLEGEKKIAQVLNDAVIMRLTWLFSLPERNMRVNKNILWNVVSGMLKGEVVKLPSHEYRGHTYVYDLIQHIPDILNLPAGIYHTGSMNDESTYDVGVHILKTMGFKEREDKLIQRDDERYKEKPRDIRIDTNKLASHGIKFENTMDGIERAIKDFGLMF